MRLGPRGHLLILFRASERLLLRKPFAPEHLVRLLDAIFAS
jgi:hypothetical protein